MNADGTNGAASSGPVISEEEAAALLERQAPRAGEARPLDLAKLRITQGRLPMLETVYQSFVAAFAKALTGLLKREMQVSLQRIETQKAADYFASLSVPANITTCTVKPLKGSAIFSIEPALVTLLVDSFFGGSGRAVARNPEAGLTPSELRFAQQMLKQMCTDLKQAWVPVTSLEFEAGKCESNPSFVKICSPGDDVLVSRFLVELPAGGGHIDLVMPEAMFAPLRENLSGAGPSPGAQQSGAHWPAAFREYLKEAKIEVRGVLAETRVNLRVLRGLKPGDVIPVDAPASGTLWVDNVPVYSGKFGLSRGRNALKLTGPYKPVQPPSF